MRWMDDEWRRWIAENLLLDRPRESVLETMVAEGFAPDTAAAEIDRALQSPYLLGAGLLRNRLKKREWLLAAQRKSARLHSRSGEIERRHRLPAKEFFDDYYSAGRPVIITGMMDDWPAMKKWSLDYFAETFGGREAEVQMGREAGANYEIEREKYARRMRFGDFVGMVRAATGPTNDFYLVGTNNSVNKAALPELWGDIVQIPEYLDGDPAGGFFWLGPPGTVTPFHHDLTNNFMAQVMGRKRVLVSPAWDVPLMRNFRHVFSEVDGRAAPAAPMPPPGEPQILECILSPGEILFLPVGCMHFVEGLDVSVTVSFTNFRLDNDFAGFYTTYEGV